MDVYSKCIVNQIRLEIQWHSRSLNETADFLSKIYDSDDWGITDEFFDFLNSIGPRLTFDRFANSANAKLPLFNSKYWDVGTAGINAFCQDWSGHYNLLVPPVYLVLRCFHYWTNNKAKGILVTPAWKSADFWPVFFPKFSATHSSIRFVFTVQNNGHVFKAGSCAKSLFARNLINEVLIVGFDSAY